jgi:alpha/beta superfamily hydrolase
MAVETQTFALTTSDGVSLDADFASVADATTAVVLCHPHPLYGGDRRNGVIESLFRALPVAGVSALRFDFRGVGRSTGTHDHGVAERLDVIAAIEALQRRHTGAVWVVGYSFGAWVALDVADSRLAGWVAVAPPIAAMRGGASPGSAERAAALDPRPTHLLVPEHDQYSPPEPTRASTTGWVSCTMETIAGADHFLAGRLGAVTASVSSWLAGGAAPAAT